MNIDVTCALPVVINALRNQLFAIPRCFPRELGGWLAGMLVDRIDIDPPTVSRPVALIPLRQADGSTVDIAGHRVRFSFRLHVRTTSLSNVRSAKVTAGPDPGAPQLGWVESPPPETLDLQF